MAIYVSRGGHTANKELPKQLAAQFRLATLDHNWLADEDAVTSLTVNQQGEHPY
jgi:hypothetical protein